MKDEDVQQWTLANISRKKIPHLFKEISDLRVFLCYDSNYQTVFEKAILGGTIEDSDYKSTLLINFAKLPAFLKYPPSQNFGILLTPQTDKKDVVTAFRRYQAIQKELNSDIETYISTDKRIDKRAEIERDRSWYWRQKNGQTYWQIAQADGISRDDFEDFYKDRIAKAVKSYKQKLGAE